MSPHEDRQLSPREAILRGVFEQNHGVAALDQREAAQDRGSRPKTPWLVFLYAILAAFLYVRPDLGSSHIPEPTSPPTFTSASIPLGYNVPVAGGLDLLRVAETFERLLATEPPPAPAIIPALPARQHPQDYGRLLDETDVPLTSLFGLAVQTIVIDPGHGGRDPGAIGTAGTREKDLTLDIALRLRDRLKKLGLDAVMLTREADETITPLKRVEFANASQADLFVSIHINSLPEKPLNVIETYYFGPPQNEETLRLAEQENQGSEYALDGFRAIIEKIGDTLKRQESVALASSIQRSLFTNIREYDSDVRDVGVKVAPFVVLLGVDAPAVLAEISCITNDEEEAKLNSPSYREKIASFLEDGIIGYLNRRHLHAQGEEEHGQSIDG